MSIDSLLDFASPGGTVEQRACFRFAQEEKDETGKKSEETNHLEMVSLFSPIQANSRRTSFFKMLAGLGESFTPVARRQP